MTTSDSTYTAEIGIAIPQQIIRSWTLIALIMFGLSIVFWIGFTTVGGIFFTLSDGIALFLGGSMIPVMRAFDRLLRPSQGGLSSAAKLVGVTGMVLAMAGSVVLLTSEVTHEFIPASGGLGMQFVGFGLEGIWLLLLGYMAGQSGLFSKRLEMTAYLAGSGFLLGGAGAVTGPESLPVAVGGLLSLIGFTLWVLYIRKELATP